jgi:hypothetical protein
MDKCLKVEQLYFECIKGVCVCVSIAYNKILT